ncbi:MAG TPA: DUF998 domain-containing protein [Gemmatimonadales bacterium]|nr:DUF998 domain-containing protein [Gemmatimonadales bacterium]
MAEYSVAVPTRGSPADAGTVSGSPVVPVKSLLVCGILSSLLYAGMNIFIPLAWDGYNSASRVVSELSAIGAPTRSLWVPFGFVWAVLVAAFGLGVWMSAERNRPLRVVGLVLLAYGLFNFVPWPPMHQREVLAAGGATLTDTLHLVWSFVAVSFMMVAMAFGAAAFGKRFRLYSITTIVILMTLGVLTGRDAPRIQANLPTPLVGVWERISIGVFLLWVVVLALAVWRRPGVKA